MSRTVTHSAAKGHVDMTFCDDFGGLVTLEVIDLIAELAAATALQLVNDLFEAEAREGVDDAEGLDDGRGGAAPARRTPSRH
jgi:hypothetical protein